MIKGFNVDFELCGATKYALDELTMLEMIIELVFYGLGS